MALMPVAEALEIVLAGVMPLGPEQVGLAICRNAHARALSFGSTHQPAVRCVGDGRLRGARERSQEHGPQRLRVTGESRSRVAVRRNCWCLAKRSAFLPAHRCRMAPIPS